MKLKDTKGSITIFVLVGLLFMASFLMISYGYNVNKSKIAKEQFNSISKIYMPNDNIIESYKDSYTALVNKNKQNVIQIVEDSSIIELTNTIGGYIKNLKIYGRGVTLPAEYTALEYIQSTGTQYIDTGVSPTDEIGCYTRFTPLSSGTVFGAITNLVGYSNSPGYYGIQLYSEKFEIYWGTNLGEYGEYSINNRYDLEFNYMNTKKVSINEEDIYNLESTDNITSNNIYIFKLNPGGWTSGNQAISAQLYRAKITDGNTLIKNFIPCKRNSDGEVGLYDTCNNLFYTNQGSGTFSAGDVIGEIGNNTNENVETYQIDIIVTNSDEESKTYSIYLESALQAEDYIDLTKGKVIRADGTEESINLSKILIYDDYTKIEVVTSTETTKITTPEKIEVEYEGYTLE